MRDLTCEYARAAIDAIGIDPAAHERLRRYVATAFSTDDSESQYVEYWAARNALLPSDYAEPTEIANAPGPGEGGIPLMDLMR